VKYNSPVRNACRAAPARHAATFKYLQLATRGCRPIGFALCVRVCLSGCQKLIISSLHHILHSSWGFGPIQACPSVCPFLSEPGQTNFNNIFVDSKAVVLSTVYKYFFAWPFLCYTSLSTR